jgi:hypothetical protein
MPELAIPLFYRAETIQPIVALLRSGESCAIVGVGSSGKSNIARHLARADVRRHYFGSDGVGAFTLYLNCKPLALNPPHDLYLHTLDQICRSLEEQDGLQARLRASVDALWQEAQANPALLAKRNLDRALGQLVRAGAEHIVIMLDDCDDLLANAPPVLFGDLRELRDNHKVRLVYLTLTRREPVFLRDPVNTPEYEDFFELISSPGQTFPLPPYTEADGFHMLRRLAVRQEPPQELSETDLRRLYELGGGHAGLMRALFFATRQGADFRAPDAIDRLAARADVEADCRKIWDSLEQEERDELARMVQGQLLTPEGQHRLERRGLIRIHLTRPAELFSPIFEKCIAALVREQSALATPPVFEFPGDGPQVRVNEELITKLSMPEYEILRYLHKNSPEVCSFGDLIEVMRLAERGAPAEGVHGTPMRRLNQYVHQLKAKIGPAAQVLLETGEGYLLAA